MKKKILCLLMTTTIFATIFTGCSINESVDHTDEYSSPISEEKAEDILADNYEAAEWTAEDEDPNDLSPTYDSSDEYMTIFTNFDYWNFKNYSAGKYNVTSEDAGRLVSELSNSDKMTIRKMLLYKNPAGHCYGMSVTAALVNRGTKAASDLTKSNTLKKSSKTDSVLEYYFVQQALSLSVNKENEFLSLSNDNQISRLVRIAMSGDPFVVAYGWYKDSSATETGHAVVGYGIESGNWKGKFDFRGRNYPYRICIYDSNYPGDKSGAYDIYVNPEENIWCIPGYKVYSTSSLNQAGSELNNGRLYRIVTGDDYLNAVDYNTGATSDAYKVLNGSSVPNFTLAGNSTVSIESTSGSASINGTTITDSELSNIHAFAMCDTAADSSTIFITLPENADYYKIDSSDKNLNFIFRVGTTGLYVDVNSPGETIIKKDGTVEIKADEKDALITAEYTSSDKNIGSDGSNSISITEKHGSYVTLVPLLNGINVDGDPNAKISISGEKFGTTIESADLDSKNNNISVLTNRTLITIKDSDTGNTLATEKVPSLSAKLTLKSKKAVYTGKNINIAAATKKNIKGKVFYTYYKDKKCTKQAKSHKDFGTYYVQAKSIINGYAIKSNIAKLEILKSATKVKFAKTSFSLKKSAVKKKSRVYQLKTNANGAMSYKKLSGNKNITVSPAGKVTVKKGTDAGTYKVKVTAVSKNYKNKIAQIITINIK